MGRMVLPSTVKDERLRDVKGSIVPVFAIEWSTLNKDTEVWSFSLFFILNIFTILL